jgi:hypothetical protein
LTAVNFQRWATAIYAPNTGSSPSIYGSALNFENNTKDIIVEHPSATGHIDGADTFLKTEIPINAPLYEVNQDPKRIIVAKKGGDFSSIKSAVDWITGSSSSNRFVVSVGPGEFFENEIDLTSKPYVSIVGSNIQTTQIFPNSTSQHIIKLGINNEISFLSLSGAGSSYSAIYVDDIGDFAQAHKISVYDCDIGVWVKSSTQDTKFYGEYMDFNGDFTYGVRVDATNSFSALANMENYYLFPTYDNVIGNSADGLGARLNLYTGEFEGAQLTGSTAIKLSDQAELEAGNLDIQDWNKSFEIPNSGGGPVARIVGSMIHNSITYDIEILNPAASFRYQGISDHTKIYNVSNNVFWNFLDDVDGENDITRKISVTFSDGTHTDASTLIFQSSSMGLLNGGTITIVSGLTINTTSGFGYVADQIDNSIIKRYDWNNNQITLSANTNNYIYISNNGSLVANSGLPDPFYSIIMGRVVTNSTGIELIDQSPYNAQHTANLLSSFNRQALGPVFSTGSIVTTGTTAFTLDVSTGNYWLSENNFLPTGGTSINFTQYWNNGSGFTTSATTYVNSSQFNPNQNSLSSLTSSYYTKHTLYVVGDGINEEYFLVLGQNEYATLIETEDAPLPIPPDFFTDGVVSIASIYIKDGESGIVQIEDIRPVIGFKSSGVNATSVHGNLLGLTSDDHQQYILVDGGRQMTGDLGIGGFDIYNINQITSTGITTNTLNVANLSNDESLTRYVVVDVSGNTFYKNEGQSGVSGSSGSSGSSGQSGSSGSSGFEGSSGSSGISGSSGSSGESGSSGTSGFSGSSGSSGESGSSGSSGQSGSSGSSGSSGAAGTSGSSGTSSTNIDTLSFTVDTGGAATISSGLKSFVYLPYSGTILSWTILSNNSGSTEIDIYKTDYANYPPTSGDTIINSGYPNLNNNIKNQSSNLSGWNSTTFNEDEILGFYVVSAQTLTRVQLILKIQK